MQIGEQAAAGHAALPPGAATEKSPGLAFLFSVLVPGLGQLYCGKVKRGLWTLFFFSLSVAGVLLLFSRLDTGSEVELFFGTALRAALVLHVFAFLDAYFTAREISTGHDPYLAKNPRVAAVLNLLTRGFGYWYLGEKKRGLLVFILIGLVSRASLKLENETLSLWLGVVVEVALAALAIDAYRMAKTEVQQRLNALPVSSGRFQPASGFTPAVPIGLAGILALGYAGLVVLGLVMPDYTTIDRSQVLINENQENKTYANPAYGVQMSIPPRWNFDSSDPGFLIEASWLDGACRVSLIAEAAFPLLTAEEVSDDLSHQILAENPNFRLVARQPTKLAESPAHELVFSADVEGTEVVQHYLLARKGLSLYALVTTAAGPFLSQCQDDLKLIREDILISK